MAGRKPKPTALKLLTGNPGKRPLHPNEPKPAVGLKRCPKHLKGAAREFWNEWAPELEKCGVATVLDTQELIYAAEYHGDYVHHRDCIAKEGWVIEAVGSKGQAIVMANPHIAMMNVAHDKVQRVLSNFGMDPTSRSRVQTVVPKEDPDSIDSFSKEIG